MLFLELRKIEILAEHVESSWLKELLTDLIESTSAEWISENKMILNNDEGINQVTQLVNYPKYVRVKTEKTLFVRPPSN